MSSGSLNDVVAALSDAFSQPDDITPAALNELKRSLHTHVNVTRNRKGDPDAAARTQDELRKLFKSKVQPDAARKQLGLFMTVLRHLRPALAVDDIPEWFDTAVKPFVDQPGSKRTSIEDAQEFVVAAMLYDESAPDAKEEPADVCARLLSILMDAYMQRAQPSARETQPGAGDAPLQTKAQAAQQLQEMLVAFGRKKAKHLFLAIDEYLCKSTTRFRALALLSSFAEQQQAHLHTVGQTAVIEHLLKTCLHDTDAVVVSAALRCLIMLLPHIPATVSSQLPRLFLIYSRCLCWEKFSSSSTKEQRDLVTDDRVHHDSDSDASDDEETHDDLEWDTLHTLPDMPETSAPELLHYFTYLYGLYPLNFTSYIRKPRKYLKTIHFPGAELFDLDQTVIRNRTEQFQRVHLLHPNFFTTTVEDELNDNRWLKADPAEVIAECHGLYAGQQTISLPSAGPPPTAKLPALPAVKPNASSPIQISGALGPAGISSVAGAMVSQSASSVAVTSEPDSPTLPPTDAPSSEAQPLDELEQLGDEALRSPDRVARPPLVTSTDVVYLQRELMLLRNELTFERYLKQQHVAAIGQLKRDHIKAVTIEAETATLINANRALQKKLSDANKFHEKMQKEVSARRTHTRQSEEQLTSKIRSLRGDLQNQEALQRDLDQARKDCNQMRQLLVESESRELNFKQQLETLEANVHDIDTTRREITELQRQLRVYRDRELQFETSQADQEMMRQDLENTQAMLRNRDQERERSKISFRARIAELESRLEYAENNNNNNTGPSERGLPDVTAELQAMLADSRIELSRTKKAYAQLLNDYTDLKIQNEELLAGNSIERRSSREPSHTADYLPYDSGLPSHARPHHRDRSLEQSELFAHQAAYRQAAPMMPSVGQSFPPARPVRPEAYQQRALNQSPLSRSEGTTYSDNLHQHQAHWGATRSAISSEYDQISPPDMTREGSKSAFSMNSDDRRSSSMSGKEKIKPQSDMRVYGRGGAQNIKMKGKEEGKRAEKSGKSNGMKGLKGLV